MQAPANDLQLIQRKRDGKELSDQQIRQLVERFVDGSLPDYQMSAFAMAVYFQGISGKRLFANPCDADSGSRLLGQKTRSSVRNTPREEWGIRFHSSSYPCWQLAV